jgi:hypothetical protein
MVVLTTDPDEFYRAGIGYFQLKLYEPTKIRAVSGGITERIFVFSPTVSHQRRFHRKYLFTLFLSDRPAFCKLRMDDQTKDFPVSHKAVQRVDFIEQSLPFQSVVWAMLLNVPAKTVGWLKTRNEAFYYRWGLAVVFKSNGRCRNRYLKWTRSFRQRSGISKVGNPAQFESDCASS